ncbi:MAG TPA: FAD-dependent oxidoreductase [Edaphobacter sp.]|jgi:pyruvate/2-oxoglutarate dehydrogenase complex dihydrolipoamide dehydrogenase (E3) component|nr:FAD-dependent oxidoreductase [Edaphobacter sp.]
MAVPERFDAIIIGSGEAGKYMAWTLGTQGQRVIAVEDKRVGGACPNIACLPSKNVVHSAKVASYFQRGREFGIGYGAWHVDMAGVNERRQKMVDGNLQVHLANFAKSHAEIVMGFGRFVGENTIEVALRQGGTRTLQAEKIFIDTGSQATIDPIPGLAESGPMTHIEALELTVLPEHLLILGGGYIGLEFAQAMRRFGARVTVIERNVSLAHREDYDVIEAIEQLFRDDGIEVLTNVGVVRVGGTSGESVTVHLTGPGGETTATGSHLLVATGRTPNTKNMGLETVGIETTSSGHIKVNDRLETTAPGVWAMGDCAGSPLFTHISFDDFRTVRDNLAGGHRSTAGRQVPSCTFIDPELAHVGLREYEAKKQGISYRLAKLPMVSNLRARTLSETRGFVKTLISENDRILGFTAFGFGGGELLPTVQLAMAADLPYTAIRSLIVAHPTIAEGLVSLFSAVPPLAGH